MIDAIKVLIALYAILLVPYMCGTIWKEYVMNIRQGIHVYLHGWIIMMAAFWIEAVPMILLKRPLANLTYAWFITALIVTVIFLINLFRKRAWTKFDRDSVVTSLRNFVIPVIVICYAIFFVNPSIQDDTVETVMTAYTTNSMYRYEPYSESKYQELPSEKAWSPIEIFYAVVADIADAHPSTVVKLIVPIGFLLVAICVYLSWSKLLFGENKKQQKSFLVFIGCIYFLPTILSNMALLSVWRNCWQGETIMATIVLPMVCYYVYDIMIQFQKEWNREQGIFYGVNLLFVAIVAQLTMSKGMIFSGIIVFAGILVIVIRRCWEKYAAGNK